MGKFLDLSGLRYGRLVVLHKNGHNSSGKVNWVCSCDCGQLSVVLGNSLNSGKSESCGCLKRDVKHGMSGTVEYKAWNAMKQRCGNSKSEAWADYGGRGITYDPDWEKFEKFYQDVGPRPEGYSLDRIDVNGNYCKENCRWADKSTQGYNKRYENPPSGRVGVHWDIRRGIWLSFIKKYGKFKHLGYFIEFDEAVKAREDAEMKYYGDCV